MTRSAPAKVGTEAEAGLDAEVIARLSESAMSAARLMKQLASEQRLALLCSLLEKECSVGELARAADLSQTTASQHLAKLRAERIVSTRRDAQTIFYRLEDPAAIRVLHTLCDIYRPHPSETTA